MRLSRFGRAIAADDDLTPLMQAMKYGKIQGIDKPVSRLILGTDTLWLSPRGRLLERFGSGDRVVRLLDVAFSNGINAFDTAPLYPSEPLLGHWLRRTGLREQVSIISKCAHPRLLTWGSRLSQRYVNSDIQRSLDRLRTDYIDLLLVHYDSAHIPATEIVDWLHEHKAKGRIRAFGVSNWRFDRVVEAFEYSAKNADFKLAAVSPHFSLIAWNTPMWPGAQSVAGEPGRQALAYYAQHDIAVLAWSPLARGFFSTRLRTGSGWIQRQRKQRVERIFGNDENYAKYRRAEELGRLKNRSCAQIALAYLLNQKLSVHPIIGCHSERHLRDSIGALEVILSEQEIRWLELRQESPDEPDG